MKELTKHKTNSNKYDNGNLSVNSMRMKTTFAFGHRRTVVHRETLNSSQRFVLFL